MKIQTLGKRHTIFVERIVIDSSVNREGNNRNKTDAQGFLSSLYG